jgi:hypothetical protein
MDAIHSEYFADANTNQDGQQFLRGWEPTRKMKADERRILMSDFKLAREHLFAAVSSAGIEAAAGL